MTSLSIVEKDIVRGMSMRFHPTQVVSVLWTTCVRICFPIRSLGRPHIERQYRDLITPRPREIVEKQLRTQVVYVRCPAWMIPLYQTPNFHNIVS